MNVTEPVTFLCLIVGGSNKMHQGENYQNVLKWGRGVFMSFSYNNQMNLKVFFTKFAIRPPLPLTIRHKRVTLEFSR